MRLELVEASRAHLTAASPSAAPPSHVRPSATRIVDDEGQASQLHRTWKDPCCSHAATARSCSNLVNGFLEREGGRDLPCLGTRSRQYRRYALADPANLESVRELLHRKREELIRRYGAVGVAIGKPRLTDSSYVIVVYLPSRSNLPAAPQSVEGVPLKFEVTGRFRPL